jgi:hypothetical protein
MPFEIEDVRVCLVGVRIGQRQSAVAPTPRFDMWPKVELGLLGYPRGFHEHRRQLIDACDELNGVTDAMPTVVFLPAFQHRLTLQPTQACGSGFPKSIVVRSNRARGGSEIERAGGSGDGGNAGLF